MEIRVFDEGVGLIPSCIHGKWTFIYVEHIFSDKIKVYVVYPS